MSNLQNLLVNELQHLLQAEQQLTEALPKMASAAHNPKLKEAIQEHLKQTQGHVEKVQEALQLLGAKSEQKVCTGMKGLITEGDEIIAMGKGLNPELSDLALAAAAQRVEHFEIASYGTARTIARLINQPKVASLLETILSQEEAADFLLTTVSKPVLQQAATEYYTPQHLKHEPVAAR